jgi:acyl-CoA thioesterase FadM
MERVQLHLTDHFAFSTNVIIRITDLNYGGHVGNDVFLSLIHEARQQFLQHHGYAELQFEEVGLIMVDAAIEFKRELNHKDIVKISVAATSFNKLGFDLHYLLEIEENGKSLVAGKAKTGMLCYNYDQKKIMEVPESARLKLTSV